MSLRAATLVVPRTGTGEDAAAVVEIGDAIVLVVADGAGGMGGGARAARAVVAAVQDVDTQLVEGRLHAAEVLRAVDLEIARSRGGGQTTAIVAVVREHGVAGASVGDSEAWWYGQQAGVHLTARQARKPLLGSAEAIPVAFGMAGARGTLVLGSDGLFKYAARDRIAEMVRTGDPAHVAQRLVDLARLPGGALQDDTTAVVCRID